MLQDQLAEFELCILAGVYLECKRLSSLKQIYSIASKTGKAVNKLDRLGLVNVNSSHVIGDFTVALTDKGSEVFEAYNVIDVIYVLDNCGWYIAAGDFISRLSRSELNPFLVHDYFHYRYKARARFEQLLREAR